jgi:hypothetical protein
VTQNLGNGGATGRNKGLQWRPEFAGALIRRRGSRKDRAYGATAGRDRNGETTEEESGGMRQRFFAMSQFESKRPTLNAQRPILNSEDD